MPLCICNGNGDSADLPSAETMRRFLDELDPGDVEHGAAWLADDEGNALEYEVGGNLSFERDGSTRHLPHVSKDRVLKLWLYLADGRFDLLEREAWQPGTRPPLSDEEHTAREGALAEWQLAQDREFYEQLGVEREGVPCRKPTCSRGAVQLSVFCRAHHFESIRGRACPFDS